MPASGVGRTAEAGEDLSSLREVPVAERVPDRDRAGRPRAAAQHLVALPEVRLRVLTIRERGETRIRPEVTRRPFPDVADHLMAPEEAPAARIGAHGGRGERALVEVRVLLRRRHVAPRIP